MGNEVSLPEAAIQGGPDAVRASLHAGAQVNKRMLFPTDVGPLPKGCKCTPLGYAILAWNVDLLGVILSAGADPCKPVGLPARFDFTPLQLAVALGFTDAVRRLLSVGADPNLPLQLKRGTTAPPAVAPPAAVVAALPPVQLLLPDCLARARAGDAPLHVAIDCAVAAEANVLSYSPATVGGCRMEVVEALISHAGTDLNRLNARHRTPLYKACKRRADVFVTLLATHPHIDINAGWPLFAAVKAESPALVRVLLAAGAGASCAVVNAAGQTPLSYAVHRASDTFHGRADVVALLVQAGSSVEPEMLSYTEDRGWLGVLAALRAAAPLPPPPMPMPLAAGRGPVAGTFIVAGFGAAGGNRRKRASSWNCARMMSSRPRAQPEPVDDASAAAGGSGGRGGGGGDGGGLASRGTGNGIAYNDNNVDISNNSNLRLDALAGGVEGGVVARFSPTSTQSPSAAGGTAARPTSRHARGLRFSFPTIRVGGGQPRCQQRLSRPQLLADRMRDNPLMMIFLPVLFPIIIIESIAVAFSKLVNVVLTALACLLAFAAPAILYGLYCAGRWLARPLYGAVGLCRGVILDAALPSGSGGGLPVPAALKEYDSVATTAAAGGADSGGAIIEALLPRGPSGAAAAVNKAMAKVAYPDKSFPIGAPALAEAATAAADGCAAGGWLAGGSGPASAVTALTESQGADTELPLLYMTCRDSGGPGDGPASAVSLQPLPHNEGLQLSVNGVGANVRLNLEPGNGSGDESNATSVSVNTAASSTGGGAAAGPAGLLSLASHLGTVIWRAYLGLFVSLAATFFAILLASLAVGVVEGAAQHLAPTHSQMAAVLRSRAHRRATGNRVNGGSAAVAAWERRQSGMCFGLLLAAVALRWLGGLCFWTLLLVLTTGWSSVEVYGLLYVYVQECRTEQEPGRAGAGPRHGSDVERTLRQRELEAAAVGLEGAGDGRSVATESSPGGLNGLCCVCMSRRAVMGFVHPDVVHCCVCAECEAALRSRSAAARCLICKRPATTVAVVVAT